MSNKLALKKDSDLVHKLFYWSYPTGSVLSKSKVAAVCVFLYLFIVWISAGLNPVIIFILSLFFAGITFLVGFLFHLILSKPSQNKIRNNDYGLVEDIKHLAFYWQDRNGNYILSKTKIISFVIFVVMYIVGLFNVELLSVLTSILFALIFEVPAFIIGSAIHKLTFKDLPKKEIPSEKVKPASVEKVFEIPQKPEIIPEYLDYQIQLDSLNSIFTKKEKSTRTLIEKRFQPPQLTYTRFISGVDKSSQLFKRNIESAFTMISLADEYSPRIAGEIESKIKILNAIMDKLDDLSNELVLNEDLSKKEDVDNLINEMDDLIQSVKKYDS